MVRADIYGGGGAGVKWVKLKKYVHPGDRAEDMFEPRGWQQTVKSCHSETVLSLPSHAGTYIVEKKMDVRSSVTYPGV